MAGNTESTLVKANNGIESGIRISAHNFFTGQDEYSDYSSENSSNVKTPEVIVNGYLPEYTLEGILKNTSDRDQTINDVISWDNKSTKTGVKFEAVNPDNIKIIDKDTGKAISGYGTIHSKYNDFQGITLNHINIKKGQTLTFKVSLRNAQKTIRSLDADNHWIRFSNGAGKQSVIKVALEHPIDLSNQTSVIAGINLHKGGNWDFQAAPNYVQDQLKNFTPEQVKKIFASNPFGQYSKDDDWGNTTIFTNGYFAVNLDAPYEKDGKSTTLQKEVNKVGYVTDMSYADERPTDGRTYLYFSDKPNDKFLATGQTNTFPQAKTDQDIVTPDSDSKPGGAYLESPGISMGVHPIIITKDITLNVGDKWNGTNNLIAVKKLNSSLNKDFFPKDDTNWDKNWDTTKLGPKPIPAQKYDGTENIFSEKDSEVDQLSKLENITTNDGFKIDSTDLPMKDGKVTTPGQYVVTYSMPISVPKMSTWGKVIPGEYYTVMVQRQAKVNVLGEKDVTYTEHVNYVDDNGNPIKDAEGWTSKEVTKKVNIKTVQDPTTHEITTTRTPNIETFDEFAAPEIPGYTYRGYKIGNSLLMSGKIPQTKLGDVTYNAVYTANDQSVKVNFVDNSDPTHPKTIHTQTLNGKTGQTVTMSEDGHGGTTKFEVPTNWVIVPGSKIPKTIPFNADSKDNPDQTVYIQHKKTTVNVDKDNWDTYRTTTETVYEKDPVTGEEKQVANIPLTFTRTGVKDEVTNTTNWSTWTPNTKDSKTGKFLTNFPEVDVTKPAYTATSTDGTVNKTADGKFIVPASDKVDPDTLTKENNVHEIHVTYIADTLHQKINFVDNSDKKTVVGTQDITGTTGQTVTVTKDGANNTTKLQVPDNWKVVGSYPGTINFGTSDGETQTVYIEHATQDVTNDPDANKETPSSKTVTYKVIERFNGQDKTLVDKLQTFTRTLTKDLVTGQVTPGAWKGANVIVDPVNVAKAGYTAAADTVDLVDGKVPAFTISPDSESKTVVVTYTAGSHKMTYTFHDDTDNKDVKTSEIRGNTDQTVDTNLVIPTGYKLAEGQTLPTSYKFTAAKKQSAEIHLVHKHETTDGRKDMKNPDVYRTVTRTWKSDTVPGLNPHQSGSETLEFFRIKTVDEAKKAAGAEPEDYTSYSAWKSNMTNGATAFGLIDTKVPTGYTVAMTNAAPEVKDGKTYIPAQSALDEKGNPVASFTVVLTYSAKEQANPVTPTPTPEVPATPIPDGQATVIYRDKKGNEISQIVITLPQSKAVDPTQTISTNLPADWILAPNFTMPTSVQANQTVYVDVVAKPVAQDTEGKLNDKVPAPEELIKNKDQLPDGTKYIWKKQPDLTKLGAQVGIIEVVMPNGETFDLEVTIQVKATAWVEPAQAKNVSVVAKQKHVVNVNRVHKQTKTLPQTGSKANAAELIGFALASTASLLGLTGSKKRKHN